MNLYPITSATPQRDLVALSLQLSPVRADRQYEASSKKAGKP